jgi:GNAT superfamily N-acetyltransferase
MEIVELHSEVELRAAFPVMRELRSGIDEDHYLGLINEMMLQGYRLLALQQADQILALAGLAVLTNLYYGRHVWVYDLVTTSEARSQGYGRLLLSHVEAFAREQGCALVALASGLQRTEAHRFYIERMGYERSAYVFEKRLR